jgi:hypothetical protein
MEFQPSRIWRVLLYTADIDCRGGVEEDWEQLVINHSGSKDTTHYASIRWKRDECRDIYPDLR